MTDGGNAEIDLAQLAGIKSFVVAADEQLTITWASEPVLRRAANAVGLKVTDIVEPIEPREEISPSSIARNVGMQYQVLLKNGDCSTPLTGQWVRSRGGFILLACPDARKPEDLDGFSYDDFPEDDLTIELLATRDEHAMSFREAKSAARALREERDFAETLINTAQVIVLVMDVEGRIVHFNPYMEELSGYSLDEVKGKDWFSTFLPEEDRSRIRELFQKAVSDIQTKGNVNSIVTKDGSEREIEWYDKTLKDVDGNLKGLFAVGIDVTERKQAKEALMRERAELNSVYDNLEEIIFIVDPDTYEILNVNQAAKVAYQNELIGGVCYKELHGLDSPCEFCTEEILLTKKYKTHQWEFHNSFLEKDFAITDRLIRWPDGREVKFEIAIDITERKQAEEKLRKSEAFQRTLVEALPDFIFILDEDSVIRKVNRVHPGLREEDIVGQRASMFVPPKLRGAFEEAFRQALDTGRLQTLETKVDLPDGPHYFLNRLNPISLIGNDRFVMLITTDITKRKKAEEEVQRLATIVEQTAEGIAVVNLDGHIQFANYAWAAVHGYDSDEELKGRHLSIFHSDEQFKTEVIPFIEVVKQRGHNSDEVGHLRKDGTKFPTMMSITLLKDERGMPYAMAGFMQDISKNKNLEYQLSHAQKLEAVGKLAAGIAHEINTPAQFVGDSVHFLKEAFEDQRELVVKYRQAMDALGREAGHEDLLKEIREAEETADLEYLEENVPGSFERCIDGLSRISAIVGAMKEFAHPDQREKSPADLNQALQSTLTIAKNEYKYVADVEIELGELPPVSCYLGDLNQVFLNLIVNAAHAIGDVVGNSGAKGVIRVRTALDGDTVRIEIEDTGCGIPAAVRERIFDPFFTTKEVGKGSGQGLAIAHSVVVDKHDGSLTCESEEGKGTTFIIRFPVAGKGAKTMEVVS